jgi:hypothetical protein
MAGATVKSFGAVKCFLTSSATIKPQLKRTQKISLHESTSPMFANNMCASTPVLLNHCRLLLAQLGFRFDKIIKHWHSNSLPVARNQ